ncbi:5-carboxymethyl-2-hydroxymuconate Delta-isomerase [Streptomyces sp. NPDC048297]|uniref:5-carboxymethyl-2-hydroxymuconate Delta-isomerase n=1 Tax=Streptomyces sp. NPDC048297 TaxID=3365531 RepID=UPI003721C299
MGATMTPYDARSGRGARRWDRGPGRHGCVTRRLRRGWGENLCERQAHSMPVTNVDCSSALASAFDCQGFAHALHPLVCKIIGAEPQACRTHFRRLDERVTVYGASDQAVIHIELMIMSGRSEDTRAELGREVLALARAHTADAPRLTVQTSVLVSEVNRRTSAIHTEPGRKAG